MSRVIALNTVGQIYFVNTYGSFNKIDYFPFLGTSYLPFACDDQFVSHCDSSSSSWNKHMELQMNLIEYATDKNDNFALDL